jgi:hypothetical protein
MRIAGFYWQSFARPPLCGEASTSGSIAPLNSLESATHQRGRMDRSCGFQRIVAAGALLVAIAFSGWAAAADAEQGRVVGIAFVGRLLADLDPLSSGRYEDALRLSHHP